MYQNQQTSSNVAAPSHGGLAEWGLNEVAYIKAEQVNGAWVHVVHAANGEELAAAGSAALAAAMIIQNGMTPVYAH